MERRTAGEQREAVIDAAIQEFAAQGYRAARTAAIAKRAGISQPYLYALFADKKALFLACHERVIRRLSSVLVAAGEGAGSVEEGLARADRAYRELLRAQPAHLMFQLQAHAAAGDPEIRDAVRGGFVATVDAACRAIGAPRRVVLDHVARGLLLGVALAVDLPAEYRPGIPEDEESTPGDARPDHAPHNQISGDRA